MSGLPGVTGKKTRGSPATSSGCRCLSRDRREDAPGRARDSRDADAECCPGSQRLPEPGGESGFARAGLKQGGVGWGGVGAGGAPTMPMPGGETRAVWPSSDRPRSGPLQSAAMPPDAPLLPPSPGTPLPPRGIRLEAQNFHVRLSWEPDPGSPGSATYQVEWKRR